MTSVYDGPVPGTTLKNLIEQGTFLDEFLGMVRRRFELDKQYIDDLRKLRASANPKWAKSAVEPIVSPFLSLLDEEIELRENTTNTLLTRLDELPPSESPNGPDKEGITPMIEYKELQTYYQDYLLRYKEVNTQECIASLWAWYQRPRVQKPPRDMTTNEIEAYILPEVDRKYRESVVNQRRISQRCLTWHKDRLPHCLDAHQQHVEDIKAILESASMEFSRLASQLVQAFAKMTNTVSDISSSKFIASLHASQEKEAEHSSMQPVVYRNFYTDAQVAHPVFGLPLSEDYLNFVIDRYYWNKTWVPLSISEMFELEKTASEASFLPDPVKDVRGLLAHHIASSFLSIPLLLQPPTSLLAKNDEWWTRNRLAEQMKTVSDLKSHQLKRFCNYNVHGSSRTSAALLCHNPAAANFLKCLLRKWDFENNSPLPDGVVREYIFVAPRLVWKKTGKDYSPSQDALLRSYQ